MINYLSPFVLVIATEPSYYNVCVCLLQIVRKLCSSRFRARATRYGYKSIIAHEKSFLQKFAAAVAPLSLWEELEAGEEVSPLPSAPLTKTGKKRKRARLGLGNAKDRCTFSGKKRTPRHPKEIFAFRDDDFLSFFFAVAVITLSFPYPSSIDYRFNFQTFLAVSQLTVLRRRRKLPPFRLRVLSSSYDKRRSNNPPNPKLLAKCHLTKSNGMQENQLLLFKYNYIVCTYCYQPRSTDSSLARVSQGLNSPTQGTHSSSSSISLSSARLVVIKVPQLRKVDLIILIGMTWQKIFRRTNTLFEQI